MTDHVWDPDFEAHGGKVAIFLPLVPGAAPVRMVQADHPERLVKHFRCSHCGQRATERYENVRVDAKPISAAAAAKGIKSRPDGLRGDKHEAFTPHAIESPPTGPCPGRPA